MASTAYYFPPTTTPRTRSSPDLRFGLALASVLTPIALLIHGYHPYTEDGGVYLVGARRLLNPLLYPHDTAFVIAPTRFSLFAPVLAGLTRLSGLSPSSGLDHIVLLLHVATVWATLAAAWLLVTRLFQERAARCGALLLLTCWLGMPVAGTSLLLMDPYLTARSFATPCLLLALAGVLQATAAPTASPDPDRRWISGLALAAASIAIAAVMHPLMAAYAVEACALLAWIGVANGRVRRAGLAAIALACLSAAWLVHAIAPAETPEYTAVALSRSYWFLSQWHWYELAGIAGPVAVLTAFATARPRRTAEDCGAARSLAQAAICGAVLATAIAGVFVRQRGPEYLLARLQPLRELDFVYLVMILLLGAWLGRTLLSRHPARWLVAGLILATPLYFAGRHAASHSRHIEFPWQPPANPWSRAFLWVRDNTPRDALFALYADYVKAPAEDAQSFRAIAERSVLADYSKDGGEASIAPRLTGTWVRQQLAQQDLATETDALRRTRLAPLGVTWIVLEAARSTSLSCPYRNEAVEVCELR